MTVVKNKENTFTEINRFLVYSDQLDATVRTTLDTAGEMIARSAIQTFEDEGETVTATDASYLAGLTVDGKSVQAGTPTILNPVDVQVVRSPNLIPFDIATIKTYNTSGTWSGNTYTFRGIDAVFNDDGTVTINGTATGNYALNLANNANQLIVPIGSYTLTGEVPGTGSDASWYFQATTTTNAAGSVKDRNRDYGSGVTFAVDDSVYGVAVYFHASSGNAFDHVTMKPQLIVGSQVQTFVPYSSIGLKVDNAVTVIDLKSNFLASLPDGTKDVLTVDSTGHCEIEKHVGYIASYNSESVGDNYISTTGELSAGASVYYELTAAQTIDCGYISMPAIADGAEISVWALITPTIAVKWWTKNQNDVGTAFSALSSDLAALQGAMSALDARVTALESANAKSLVLEKTEVAKELASEPEETDEQEEMDFEE